MAATSHARTLQFDGLFPNRTISVVLVNDVAKPFNPDIQSGNKFAFLDADTVVSESVLLIVGAKTLLQERDDESDNYSKNLPQQLLYNFGATKSRDRSLKQHKMGPETKNVLLVAFDVNEEEMAELDKAASELEGTASPLSELWPVNEKERLEEKLKKLTMAYSLPQSLVEAGYDRIASYIGSLLAARDC